MPIYTILRRADISAPRKFRQDLGKVPQSHYEVKEVLRARLTNEIHLLACPQLAYELQLLAEFHLPRKPTPD